MKRKLSPEEAGELLADYIAAFRHWNAHAIEGLKKGLVYYRQAYKLSACASFEVFKGSAAYEEWKRTNERDIETERAYFASRFWR